MVRPLAVERNKRSNNGSCLFTPRRCAHNFTTQGGVNVRLKLSEKRVHSPNELFSQSTEWRFCVELDPVSLFPPDYPLSHDNGLLRVVVPMARCYLMQCLDAHTKRQRTEEPFGSTLATLLHGMVVRENTRSSENTPRAYLYRGCRVRGG